MIKGTFIMPHPPVLIPEIGKGSEGTCQELIHALDQIAEDIKALEPETIVVITPHGPVFSDGVAIGYDEVLKGDLGKFGAPDIEIKKMNDLEMVDKIIYESSKIDIPCLKLNDENIEYFNISKALDHGATVPLYFVEKTYMAYKIVHITYGMFASHKLYEFGMTIKEVIESMNKHVVVIASGDLSHCLKEDGPYTYSPSGQLFDDELRKLLVEKDVVSTMFMDEEVRNEASECGKRSFDIMLGMLDGCDYKAKELSYIGPFGVGYLAMSFTDLKQDDERLFFPEIMAYYESVQASKLAKESHFVRIARHALEQYFGMRDDIFDDQLPAEMFEAKAGTFVSLKKHGALRGCMGTIGPTQDNVALEVISNAIKAAFEDPRFPELEAEELYDIDISVDVLLEPEIVDDLNRLDPSIYGVIVSSGYKRGLLLPNLDGIETVEEQLKIAKQKGSISEEEACTIERFEVVRYV